MNGPVIGKSVDSWCAPCKLMLAHTIEAVINEKITRTHCNTCGAQHAYRRNPPGTSTKVRGGSAAKGRYTKATLPVVDYEALLRGKDAAKARAYKTSDRFKPQELIHHPVFGLGFVVGVRDTNKIDVGFSDGLRTLMQDGPA